MAGEARTKVLAAAYACIAEAGTTGLTIDEIAQAAGVSRASIYRWFPGGRDEVIAAAVGWEIDNFFLRVAAALGEPPDFASFLERALPVARRELLAHEGLARILEREPAEVATLLASQYDHVVVLVAAAFRPRLAADLDAGLLVGGVDLDVTAEYVARLAVSLMAEPGEYDLDDPAVVRELVRRQLLGGVLAR